MAGLSLTPLSSSPAKDHSVSTAYLKLNPVLESIVGNPTVRARVPRCLGGPEGQACAGSPGWGISGGSGAPSIADSRSRKVCPCLCGRSRVL